MVITSANCCVVGDMEHAELAEGDLLSDEVDVQLDVFGAPMMDGVGSHVDAGDVVAEDDGGRRERGVDRKSVV